MKKVFTASHPTEAHLVRGLLENEGLRAIVQGEDLFSTRGRTPVTSDTLPTVWVPDEDEAQARALIAAAQSAPDAG